MADKLLDLEGLTYYDQKIKDYIDTADSNVTSDLTDKITEETQARTQADMALGDRIDDAKSELLGDAGTNYNTLGKLEDVIQAEVMRAGEAEDAINGDLQSFKTSTNQNITQIEKDLGSEGERITALDNNAVKKTGQTSQTIQGNIQIQGDLTVNGTTTSEDHQTLMVQDNIIVTNSDGVAISGLSGMAIRINSTSAFGIVYDPSVQELKAGLGTLSAENEFTFSSGEGYPITLRDSDGDLVNGNVVMWDNVGKRLTDSGIVANLIALQNGTYEDMTVGNATNAVNATNDGSGQNIASTYATKAENNAKYTKPDGGIPKTDLASAVQTSLNKADTALQSIPAATPSRLGGVKPVSKTAEMTQSVGVDGFGELWSQPTGIEKNEIISVESLPTATADSPDFVQTPDGKLYRKAEMPSDNSVLAGTWVFDDTINYEGQLDVNFTSNGEQFIGFKGFTEDGIGSGDQYYNLYTFVYLESGTSVSAYMYGTDLSNSNYYGWSSGQGEEYRIVTFAEGTVNSDALSFMQSNAVKQSVYSYEEVGGTEVVANPTATGTQDLTSLQVGSTVYNIPTTSIEYMTDAEVDALFLPPIPSFEDATWAQIAKICEAGISQYYFSAGDEKTIELTTGEQVTLIILGFNHDDLSDGTGKSSITFGLKNALTTNYPMNTELTNSGGWGATVMRTSTLQTVYGQLPTELKELVKSVNKLTARRDLSGEIEVTSDKLFLFSQEEVMGTNMESVGYNNSFSGEGKQYEYFKNAYIPTPISGTGKFSVLEGTGCFYTTDSSIADKYNNRFGEQNNTSIDTYYNYNNTKAQGNNGNNAIAWWLRSPYRSSPLSFCYINSPGYSYRTGSDTSYGVVFGFCI